MRHHLRLYSVAVAAVLGVAAPIQCPAQSTEQRLTTDLESARADVEYAHAQLLITIESLNELQNRESDDLKPYYDQFAASIEETRKVSETTRRRYETLSAERKNYFAAWQNDLNGMADKEAHRASEKRLHAVEKEYQDALKHLEIANEVFAPLLTELDAFKTALAKDLSPAGLKALGKSLDQANRTLANSQAPVQNALIAFNALTRYWIPRTE